MSRQYEHEYPRYYGWPFYWQGDALWGLTGFPILELPSGPPRAASEAAIGPQPERADAHLRRPRAFHGYHLQPGEEIIGVVCDFMVDDQSWGIGELVVNTGHRHSGKEVLILTNDVERTSYETSTVFVKATKAALEQSSATPLSPPAGMVN